MDYVEFQNLAQRAFKLYKEVDELQNQLLEIFIDEFMKIDERQEQTLIEKPLPF